MQLVSLTALRKFLLTCCFLPAAYGVLFGQDNSPYSRYGLGDKSPGQNILNRSLGGVSAAYNDPTVLNFINPASYSKLLYTSLDIGLDFNSRTLRQSEPAQKYTSKNLYIGNLVFGVPLKKKGGWGFVFGLKPETKISYKITELSSVPGADSLFTLYEGSGGTFHVFAGTGFSIGNLSIGFNAGYLFGNKDYSTKLSFLNDSVLYFKSNTERRTFYNGFLGTLGLQYNIPLDKEKSRFFRIGAYGNGGSSLQAKRDEKAETFNYDANGGTYKIDSVSEQTNIPGRIKYPSSFGIGLWLDVNNRLSLGLDYTASKWSKYRYYGETDELTDSYEIKAGVQLLPDFEAVQNKSYFSKVVYRAGVKLGRDYVNVTGDQPTFGFTLGAGLPMRIDPRNPYQRTLINTLLEFGTRGNSGNDLRENYFRVSIGLSLSDIWFRQQKYY